MTLSVQYGANSAGIQRVDNVMVDASKAVAESLKTLDATAGGNANITDFAKTMSDFTQTSATKINSLSVTVNGQTAAITTNAQAVADINGNLNAMYSIKSAWMPTACSTRQGWGWVCRTHPTACSHRLFSLLTVSLLCLRLVRRHAAVCYSERTDFINDAFFRDASIQFAKITDSLKSDNFVSGPGGAGWNLPKSGNAELNNVTVRGNGEFTGKITATSGTFKGTVQAESFIGDVAVGQTFSDIEGDNVTRNFVYTDSGNLPGEKHVVIMALVKVQISATEAGAGITQTKGTAILTIGGSSRTIDVYTPPNTDRSRPTYVTVMHSARVTGQVVNCSIQMRSDNATYHANVGIYSPTIHVSRGSGSFTQS
jgi:hypothetical protein